MRFWFIGDALEWALRQIYAYIPNYAIAMLIFTLLIRLLLMPLDVKSKRSMMGMARLNPQMEALKKKYENDPEKLNRKMSELYKKENVSPLGGCLPLLFSLPILFAMFAVMNDLTQEGNVLLLLDIKEHLANGVTDYRPQLQSFLWIKNILQPDSLFSSVLPSAVTDAAKALTGYGTTSQVTAEMLEEAKQFLASAEYASWVSEYGNTVWYRGSLLGLFSITIPTVFNGWCILPPLAGLSQFFSSKLLNAGQPATTDNSGSGKFMKWFFPIFSVFICFSSNAVFALYWVVSSAVQGGQQYLIGKWITHQEAQKAAKEAANA